MKNSNYNIFKITLQMRLFGGRFETPWNGLSSYLLLTFYDSVS